MTSLSYIVFLNVYPHRRVPFQPLTKEEALMLYEDMVLGRTFEDMCAQMYYRGKMFGFVHLYNGQEAVSSGVIKYLRQDDYVTRYARSKAKSQHASISLICVDFLFVDNILSPYGIAL